MKTCPNCGRVFGGTIEEFCHVCISDMKEHTDYSPTPKTDGPDTDWPENPTEDELDLGRKD